jgi:hypothetical protein
VTKGRCSRITLTKPLSLKNTQMPFVFWRRCDLGIEGLFYCGDTIANGYSEAPEGAAFFGKRHRGLAISLLGLRYAKGYCDNRHAGR